MFNISETAKKMILIILVLFSIILAIGSVYLHDLNKIIGFFIGLFLGSSISIIKVVILEKTIDKSLDMEKQQASNFAVLMFILRYFITAFILVIAALVSSINVWGAIIGILLLQLSAYTVKIFLKG